MRVKSGKRIGLIGWLVGSACVVVAGLAIAADDAPSEDARATVACADADERFSDGQVLMSEAFSSVDFDVAKKKVAAARQAIQKGRSAAGACGCPKAADGGVKATEVLDTALETLQFADVQDRLFEAIKAGETARSAAESCWRAAAGRGSEKQAFKR